MQLIAFKWQFSQSYSSSLISTIPPLSIMPDKYTSRKATTPAEPAHSASANESSELFNKTLNELKRQINNAGVMDARGRKPMMSTSMGRLDVLRNCHSQVSKLE
jgi:hypothetical protein